MRVWMPLMLAGLIQLPAAADAQDVRAADGPKVSHLLTSQYHDPETIRYACTPPPAVFGTYLVFMKEKDPATADVYIAYFYDNGSGGKGGPIGQLARTGGTGDTVTFKGSGETEEIGFEATGDAGVLDYYGAPMQCRIDRTVIGDARQYLPNKAVQQDKGAADVK